MDQYVSSLIGGMLIGLSASFLFLLLGRIAGVSGVLGALLVGSDRSLWRVGFVLGLVVVGAVLLTNGGIDHVQTRPATLVAAGLLVGFGTRLGNGCTSGHGVCGLSRFSKRSLVATAVFMGTAVLTVFIANHFAGAGT